MNYRSPIDIMQSEIQTAIENEIYKTVVNVGINVDKVELLKALTYDRNQYTRGYYDRDSEIVRCKDCKYCEYPDSDKEWCKKGHLHGNAATWFCADGERR